MKEAFDHNLGMKDNTTQEKKRIEYARFFYLAV